MFFAADQLVANGGPSAPAWAFFTALLVGVLTIITQQLKERSDIRRLKAETERIQSEASKAAQSATQAEKNTAALSNGFAGRMDHKLDRIISQQQTTDDALRKHLEWHLNRE